MVSRYFNLLPYYYLEITCENICLYDLNEKKMMLIDDSLREISKKIFQNDLIDTNCLSNPEKNFLNDLIQNKMGYWKNEKSADISFYSSFVDTKYPYLSKQLKLDNCEFLVTSNNSINTTLLGKVIKSLKHLRCNSINLVFFHTDIETITAYIDQFLLFIKRGEIKVSIRLPFFKDFSNLKKKYPNLIFYCVVQNVCDAHEAMVFMNKNLIFYDVTSEKKINSLIRFIRENRIPANNLIVKNDNRIDSNWMISDYIKSDNSYLFGLNAEEMAFNENFNIHQLGHIKITEEGRVIADNGGVMGNLVKHSLMQVLSSGQYLTNIYIGKKQLKFCHNCAFRLGCLLKKENIIFLENDGLKKITLCEKR